MLGKKVVGLAVIWSVIFCLFGGEVSSGNYADGDGSAEFPFEIAEPNQLIYMSQHSEDWSKHFILTADINLALADPNTFTTAVIAPDTDDSQSWYQGTPFTGSFDGNDQTIFNLTIDTVGVGHDFLGLFGQIAGSSAMVKDLGLEKENITCGNDSVCLGGLCGLNDEGSINNCNTKGSISVGINARRLGGLCGYNKGIISSCYTLCSIIGGDESSDIGGTCGVNYNGSIINCYSAGNITGGNDSTYFGGICGYNYGIISDCNSIVNAYGGRRSEILGGLCGMNSEGIISNCSSSGTITGKSYSNRLGGLCGENQGFISNCYSTSIINIDDYMFQSINTIGGFVGLNYYHSDIINCHATGSISAGIIAGTIGGFCGQNRGYIKRCYSTIPVVGSYYLGGFCGRNCGGSIIDCYATGTVHGNKYLGGFCAHNEWSGEGGIIRSSYSTGLVTGDSDYFGFCWSNTGSEINYCYFLDTAGPDNGLGTPLTDSEMKQQSSFIDWDFIKIWAIDEGLSYPYHQDWKEPTYPGSGTLEDPFRISTADHLYELSIWKYHWDKHFILTTNIDMSAFTFKAAVIAPDTDHSTFNFQGIPFTGSFNGNGYTIANLIFDDNGLGNDFLGLFGQIDPAGKVTNLGMENAKITSGEESIFIGVLCGSNFGDIENCNCMGIVTGGVYLGGLCGLNDEGNINNCYANVSISGGAYIGGLCGLNIDSSISNCYSIGSVSGGSYLGGLCGENDGSIINCYFLYSAGPDNSFGEPLDDPNMRIQACFVGWDFVAEEANGSEDIWRMCVDGIEYPKLYWQFPTGDFTCPDGVEMLDLWYFCNQWLAEGDNLRCDIAPVGNPDDIVNLFDYVEFSKYWLVE